MKDDKFEKCNFVTVYVIYVIRNFWENWKCASGNFFLKDVHDSVFKTTHLFSKHDIK